MTFSDTEMMELGRKYPTNIHNTRSLIRTLKCVLDTHAYEHTKKIQKIALKQPALSIVIFKLA